LELAISQAQGNDVNELMVVNRSEKPLYLMPGEVIVGGDQDRTIGEEIIILADGKPVPINVFCVEHGRWGGRSAAQYASIVANSLVADSWDEVAGPGSAAPSVDLALVVEETTVAANSGKFIGSVGTLNKATRLAVQKGEGQSAVWDEVAVQNAKAGVQTDSGTFISNYSDAKSLERLEKYLKHFKQPIEEQENIVGVLVAVNGKVESMDVFESTPLFRKLWPKLLKSYALDAAGAADAEASQKKITRADAVAFFKDVAAAQAKPAENATTDGSVAIGQGENERVLLFSAHERRAVDASPSAAFDFEVDTNGGFAGGLGGFGGAIHSSGFAK
jgi:hypothetical protein